MRLKTWVGIWTIGIQSLLGGLCALAGTEVGNGGNVVDCRGKKRTTEALDYYEGRIMHGIQPSLGPRTLTYQQKIAIAIERLALHSPRRAAYYLKLAHEFEKEAFFLSGATLIVIPDSGHLSVPKGCDIVQVVIQKEPVFPEDKRYLVNKDLWDIMDEDARAGLVLHEIVYREAVFHGQENSINARYFNSMIASSRLESMDTRRFAEVVQLVSFRSVEYLGVDFDSAELAIALKDLESGIPVSRPVSGIYRDVFYRENHRLTDPRIEAKLDAVSECSFYADGLPSECKSHGMESFLGQTKHYVETTFFLSGKIRSIKDFYEPPRKFISPAGHPMFVHAGTLVFDESRKVIAVDGVICTPSTVLGCFPVFFSPSEDRFFPNGQVASGVIAEYQKVQLFGAEAVFEGRVTFYDTGSIKAGTLHADAVLTLESGFKQKFKAETTLRFTPEGKVTP